MIDITVRAWLDAMVMNTNEGEGGDISTIRGPNSKRPLSALLSQTLVAFTIELDNEFERRMGDAGYPGARLSLVVYLNLIQFLAEGGVAVRDLALQAFAPQERIKFELGCLERWGFIALSQIPTDGRPIPLRAHRLAGRVLRDGWGSGRGIRADWIVRLTAKGLRATEIWRPLCGEIEKRWQARFSQSVIGRLRDSLQCVVGQLDVELPHGLPGAWEAAEATAYPRRATHNTAGLPLPTLLSQSLLAFAMEFDRESRTPLAMSANVLRVLGDKPVRVGDLPHLTGASPETSAIGWRLKPFVVVEPDRTASRGKVVRLTSLGKEAQQTYRRLVDSIERRWEARFGQAEIRHLRECLEGLFHHGREDRPLLSAGLVPPESVARSGGQAPALGRQKVAAAARQRMRDSVVQTKHFIRDPAGTLPHYPMWDMNRGFGP